MNPNTKESPLDLVLLYGGTGGEREVSCLSAASIFHHLNPERYRIHRIGIAPTGTWYLQPSTSSSETVKSLGILTEGRPRVAALPGDGLWYENSPGAWQKLPVDVVFNIVHGVFGEDGRIQGLLETAGVPFTGAKTAGSALGMDKVFAKQIWEQKGLPVVPYALAHKHDQEREPGFARQLFDACQKRFSLPLFVKPANSGSSVGVNKAHDWPSFAWALNEAFTVDAKVLIEKAMTVREVEVAVLGNHHPQAYGPGEIEPTHEFYDYEAKYLDPNGARLLIPARLDPELAQALLETAVKAYKALDVRGFSRVDFFVDKESGDFYINEINTLPGFTTISMFPRMVMSSGLSYAELLDSIVDAGIERGLYSVGKS
jgi:D-alanine-D-alanine ligase